MGRSQPTIRNKIELLRDELQPFRRAMKPQNQQYYDRVFENINYLAMPVKITGRIDVKWLFLFAAVVAQQKQLDELQEEIEELDEASV